MFSQKHIIYSSKRLADVMVAINLKNAEATALVVNEVICGVKFVYFT